MVIRGITVWGSSAVSRWHWTIKQTRASHISDFGEHAAWQTTHRDATANFRTCCEWLTSVQWFASSKVFSRLDWWLCSGADALHQTAPTARLGFHCVSYCVWAALQSCRCWCSRHVLQRGPSDTSSSRRKSSQGDLAQRRRNTWLGFGQLDAQFRCWTWPVTRVNLINIRLKNQIKW